MKTPSPKREKLVARRTSRGKSSDAGHTPASDGGSEPEGKRALRLSRQRKLSPSIFLQELALRPDFLEGMHLGELLTPEPLRRHGQWVVRSQDLLSFHLELSNLHAQTPPRAPRRHRRCWPSPARGAAYITLHFAPQAIAEQVFFAASPRSPTSRTATSTSKRRSRRRPRRPRRWSRWRRRRSAPRIAYPSRLGVPLRRRQAARRRLLAGALHAGGHPGGLPRAQPQRRRQCALPATVAPGQSRRVPQARAGGSCAHAYNMLSVGRQSRGAGQRAAQRATGAPPGRPGQRGAAASGRPALPAARAALERAAAAPDRRARCRSGRRGKPRADAANHRVGAGAEQLVVGHRRRSARLQLRHRAAAEEAGLERDRGGAAVPPAALAQRRRRASRTTSRPRTPWPPATPACGTRGWPRRPRPTAASTRRLMNPSAPSGRAAGPSPTTRSSPTTGTATPQPHRAPTPSRSSCSARRWTTATATTSCTCPATSRCTAAATRRSTASA